MLFLDKDWIKHDIGRKFTRHFKRFVDKLSIVRQLDSLFTVVARRQPILARLTGVAANIGV